MDKMMRLDSRCSTWCANSQAFQAASNLYGLRVLERPARGILSLKTYFRSIPAISWLADVAQILDDTLMQQFSASNLQIPMDTPIRAFECPCLIGIKEERLPIICDSFPIRVDCDGRVVILWRSRPLRTQIHLLRIAYCNDTIVFEGCCPGPQGCDARCSGLKVRTDVM